jgi:lysophospholipid acyltransferase (LPLAT)-like uncharacterized protein
MSKALRRALGALLGAFVRMWLATLRLTIVADPALRWDPSRAAREPSTSLVPLEIPWVLALWHGQQMPLLRWIRRRSTVVLVSLSDDGELLAGALGVLGYDVARGSSSRGGASGLLGVVRRLRAGSDAALAVDGPKGPRCVVHAHGSSVGASIAAQMAHGFVVPMAAACSAAWVLRRTWDRFEIPRPVSRVAIVLGAPLAPEEADPTSIGAAIERARAASEVIIKRASGASLTRLSGDASNREAQTEVVR